MGESVHGFPEGRHRAAIAKHVENIPGQTGGETHGGGVLPAPGVAEHMNAFGPIKGGQKGHPGTD